MKSPIKINYIIYACIVLVIILAIVARLIQPKPQEESISEGPFPTTGKVIITGVISNEAGQSESYQKSVEVIKKEEEELINRESAVGQLYEYLPHRGTDMRLESDTKLDRYILTLNKERETQGNAEFDVFLKSHGIQNRNWIRPELLVVQYE